MLRTSCSTFRRMIIYSDWQLAAVLCLVTQSCLTLCDPTDDSSPGSSVRGNSPGKNTGVCCHALPWEIFPTQGSNSGLSACRQILYCLRHQESPKNTGVGSLSLLQGTFLTQKSNRDLLHCRRILYQLSYQGSPIIIIRYHNSLI